MSTDTAIYLRERADEAAHAALCARIRGLAAQSSRLHGTQERDARRAIWRAYRHFGPSFLDNAEARLAARAERFTVSETVGRGPIPGTVSITPIGHSEGEAPGS